MTKVKVIGDGTKDNPFRPDVSGCSFSLIKDYKNGTWEIEIVPNNSINSEKLKNVLKSNGIILDSKEIEG